MLSEKKLTPAEKKKREEIARAIERENPDMPMDKKMAIATATAIRVAEAMDDDDDDNKSVDTSRVQRTGDFKMVKYKDPNTGQVRWRKQKKEFKVESVQEAKDMYRSAAHELKTYANKSGGMDKKDFHTAAKHIENIGSANILNKGQHLAKFSKHLRGLDTSPREKILSVLHKHGHEVGDYMPGVKMKRRFSTEEVQEGSPERLALIRKAAEKYNKQKKAAERKAERDAKKAMSKDADLVGENNNAPQTPAHRRAMMGPPKTKKDKPPFEGPYTKAGPKKDKFGNTIKVQNMAKKLARKGMDSVTPDQGKVKLKGFGPDAPKGNMGSSTARASLKPKAPKRTDESVRLIEREDTAHHVAKTLIQMGVRHDTPEHEVLKKIPHALKKHGLAGNRNIQMDPDFHGDVFDSLSALHKKNESVHEAVHPDHVSLHPHKTDKKKYTVGQVGRNVKGRLKTGEHLNDTQVDDLHDMGMKVRHYNTPLGEARAPKDFEGSFKRHLKYGTSDNPKVKSYLATKQDRRTAQNKAMDPGAAKKGLALSVIDRQKAYAKGKKKGIGVMDIDTRPGKDHATGKSTYKMPLPSSYTPELEIGQEAIHEAVINTLQDIVKTKGAKEVKFKDGRKMKVDMQSANMLTKVHKSLNSTNAKKFADALDKGQSQFMKMLDFAYSVTR